MRRRSFHMIFSYEFVVILERFLVIPFIGYLISNGFFAPESKDWLVPLLDHTLGILFVFIFYELTHRPLPAGHETIERRSYMTSLWNRISLFVFKRKTVETVVVADPTEKIAG